MAEVTNSSDKTAAIVSYITIIGWLISFFGLNNPKSSLTSYHLRQTLLLYIIAFVFQIIIMVVSSVSPIFGMVLSFASLGFIVLWIMGLISAINGEEKPMPLIGEKAQEIFKNM